jgi:hypothetical protein
LLTSYRTGKESWDQFKESFTSELRASTEGLEALAALAVESSVQDVTLLCYEKEGLPCHRLVVRDILTDPGLLSGLKESRMAGGAKGRKFETAQRPARAPGAARTRPARMRLSSLWRFCSTVSSSL